MARCEGLPLQEGCKEGANIYKVFGRWEAMAWFPVTTCCPGCHLGVRWGGWTTLERKPRTEVYAPSLIFGRAWHWALPHWPAEALPQSERGQGRCTWLWGVWSSTDLACPSVWLCRWVTNRLQSVCSLLLAGRCVACGLDQYGWESSGNGQAEAKVPQDLLAAPDSKISWWIGWICISTRPGPSPTSLKVYIWNKTFIKPKSFQLSSSGIVTGEMEEWPLLPVCWEMSSLDEHLMIQKSLPWAPKLFQRDSDFSWYLGINHIEYSLTYMVQTR